MYKTTLFIVSLLFIVSAKAQEKDTVFNKNEVSFVFTELIDGGLHLRFERKVGDNFSIGFGGALKGKEGLVNLSGINNEQIKTNDITLSGFKLIPEVRYYIKKTQEYNLDGFYFGAFLKYIRYHSNLLGIYIDKQDNEYRIDSDASLQIVSVGLAVGYKLALNKRWNLDFIIAGPGAGFHQYSLKNNISLPDQFYEDLANALEKYSLLDYINSDFRFDIKQARTDFMLPAFRYGISIGYTF